MIFRPWQARPARMFYSSREVPYSAFRPNHKPTRLQNPNARQLQVKYATVVYSAATVNMWSWSAFITSFKKDRATRPRRIGARTF